MASTNAYRVGRPARRTLTCDMCKTRHQKCNGAQPQCSNCELRAINCSYSNQRAQGPDYGLRSPELTLRPSTEPAPQARLSEAEYDRLHAQIYEDIVRRLSLERTHNIRTRGEAEAPIQSQASSASLPSLYHEVSSIVKGQSVSDNGHVSSQANATSLPGGQIKEPDLEQHLEHVRKLLREYLPVRDISQRLLNMFFEYQNSVFYVCNKHEAQEQLILMYEAPDQVSICWFCQMFLFFAVGAQFDDMDDANGESYYSIAQKHIDDAIDENPQNTLWIIRATLLICFYQPPMKWTSSWMYFDAAIRGAHKFQLDLGHNIQNELSNEEYQEWRQICFLNCYIGSYHQSLTEGVRWVAIFLGRLPRIKESISRDPIFKSLQFESGLESCVTQNLIASLGIISGYILRDLYFSEQFSFGVLQQRKTALESWASSLPSPLKQYLESAVPLESRIDQTDATFNLYFMYPGTWMLLTRPALLRAVKTKASAVNTAGPIASAIASNAGVCIEYAFRLIDRATALLSVSLPPKRSFMPLFFLVIAAHVMILAVVWNRKQSGSEYGSPMSVGQDREFNAIEACIRVLDFCGQRSSFARKYGKLIKDLRQYLGGGHSNTGSNKGYPHSSANPANFLNLGRFQSSLAGPYRPFLESSSTASSQAIQSLGPSPDQGQGSRSSLSSEDVRREYEPVLGSLDVERQPWSDQFETFYPTDDISPFAQSGSGQDLNDMKFLDDMLQ